MLEHAAASPPSRPGLRHKLPTNVYHEYDALKPMLETLPQLLIVT